jgi:hypothetical protein
MEDGKSHPSASLLFSVAVAEQAAVIPRTPFPDMSKCAAFLGRRFGLCAFFDGPGPWLEHRLVR